MSKKIVIAFEGIEGSGKTFHIDNVSNELKYEVKNSYDLLSLTNPDFMLPHFYNFEEILYEIENY